MICHNNTVCKKRRFGVVFLSVNVAIKMLYYFHRQTDMCGGEKMDDCFTERLARLEAEDKLSLIHI